MKRLELEALYADREAVKAMIITMSDKDPVGRLSFSARLRSIEQQIQEVAGSYDKNGSVALLFGGRPVHGSRSIDAEFATSVLKTFQDLVAKQMAGGNSGQLGSRGRVPDRGSSKLAIRELVRGSVGFVLEENADASELFDTPVKMAIDDVTEIITKAADESEDAFEKSVETLDPRMLAALQEFFRTLDDGDASVRIVEDQRDESFDKQAIHRARNRLDATRVQDTESEAVVGDLLGLFPSSRRFEMKLANGDEVIHGAVAESLAENWPKMVDQPGKKFLNQRWRTKMKIREISDRNRPPRRFYTLLELIEQK